MKAVTLCETIRDVGQRPCPQPGEGLADDEGCGDAVDIEIAEHANRLSPKQSLIDSLHCLVRIGEIEQVVFPCEIRVDKRGDVREIYATIVEQMGYQRRDVKRGDVMMRCRCLDVPACRRWCLLRRV